MVRTLLLSVLHVVVVPLHAPPQPVSTYPLPACEVSVTFVNVEKLTAQCVPPLPQSRAPEAPVTSPGPVTCSVIEFDL